MSTTRGFALLAVLWVVVAFAALAGSAVEHARSDATSSGGSVSHMRSRWAAEGCLAVAQARLDSALGAEREMALPGDTLHFASGAMCSVSTVDPSSRLSAESLPPLVKARFDSLVPDSSGRDTFFTASSDGHINLNAAPLMIIAALPGMGDEVLHVIETERSWHRPLVDLPGIASRLSPAARASFWTHYGELNGLVSFHATALQVRAAGWVERGVPGSTIEELVVNAGDRVAITRRRMW